jgi:hypothetical protein
MNASVIMGVTVVFVLLVAACGVWMNAASKSVENTMDFATRVICYDSGFGDGARDDLKAPPYRDSRCVDLYTDGYGDGKDGNYDPPRSQ